MVSRTFSLWKPAVKVIIAYCGIALAFTGLGIVFGPPQAQIGGTRPQDTIPGHLAELAAFGLLLGIGSMVVYGRKGLAMFLLTPVLTVLLDIDHLPVYLGYSEPIRPAHSFVFILTVLAVTAITIKALDMDLVVLSAFMGHMAIDTGIFAPFAPITFAYIQLNPYRVQFAAAAVLCALAAGAVNRRRQRVEIVGGMANVA
jgi:hypothetical protein